MAHPRWLRRLTLVLAVAVLALVGVLPGQSRAPSASAQPRGVTLEWFGWSNFRLTSVNGKVIWLNPRITTNPDASISLDDVTKADMILVADGHGDEIGDTVEIAKRTGAAVNAPFELGTWFIEQGIPAAQVRRGNPGDRLLMDGITIRMLGSVHGSGLPAPTATTPYGGPAASFMITFENGWTIYFQGSSAATADMALWGELYKPDAMIFHMGGGKEPLDCALAVDLIRTQNPNLRALMPHHHRVAPPPGSTSIAEVRSALDAMGIMVPITDQVRGQVYTFTK